MKYFSLNNNSPNVNFKEAVVNGLAPDKGLYFPVNIPALDSEISNSIQDLDYIDIALKCISPFVGDCIGEYDLKNILKKVLDFPFPLKNIEENIFSLELFHGPTMAFKDVGARFMAQCLGYFYKDNSDEEVTVLVATSGDTGGAVANGFLGVKGIKVVILYPSGKVSNVQEKQLTALGNNVTALEVNGNFDDCQAMVKQAFLDKEITSVRKLTSANSINVARWLPQMFYYFFAFKALKKYNKSIVFSVPSGNYGNICAGMIAQKMGLPIAHFITGTNRNDTIPRYLNTNKYTVKPTVATISNAMDVSSPSNFIRIEKLHDNSTEKLKNNLSGYSFTDEETTEAVKHLYKNLDYIADPHGAIGYLALKKYLKDNKENIGVFLETAHPIKFLPVMPESISKAIEIPPQIEKLMNKKKKSIEITAYDELKTYLIKNI